MDVGNFADLHSVNNFIDIERRQSYKIGYT